MFPYDAKHEDEEDGDGHDVADGLDGDDHALDHLLQACDTPAAQLAHLVSVWLMTYG
jgi:hypothetical protein